MNKIFAWIILIVLGFFALGGIFTFLGFLMTISNDMLFNTGYFIGTLIYWFLLIWGIKSMIRIIRRKQ